MDDFYDDERYEEFYDVLEGLESKLRECVKQEFLGEMERLRKENEKLKDFKANFQQYKAEVERYKMELERVKHDAVIEAERVRFEKIIKDVVPVAYTPRGKNKDRPWCGECEEGTRLIHYKSPASGKDVSEICPRCGGYVYLYTPRAEYVSSLRVTGNDRKLLAFYDFDNDGDVYTHSIDEFDDDKPFDSERPVIHYFRSKERCQQYCDWLNQEGK